MHQQLIAKREDKEFRTVSTDVSNLLQGELYLVEKSVTLEYKAKDIHQVYGTLEALAELKVEHQEYL